MSRTLKLLLASLILSLGSCGYRFSKTENSYAHESLSVPYFEGDLDGKLTTAVTRQIALNSPFHLLVSGARLRLEGKIVSSDHDYIGFRYEREETTGEIIKRLTPDEERRNVCVEIKLIDTWSDEVILGPLLVRADADYDYVDSDSIRDLTFIDAAGQRRSVLQFSLGQLDAFEDAREASLIPLYDALAKKIAFTLYQL